MTKNSKNYNVKELRKKISTYLKENYTNSKILNIDTNRWIEFNSTSFRKLLNKAGRTKLIALLQIENIIKTAKFVYSEADKQNRKEIISILKFSNKVEICNRIYNSFFTVRELRDEKYYIYSWHIDIKKYETNRRVL